MKIEIDLQDILHDEDYGSETLQESIKRQVIANLTERAKTGIAKKIDDEIAKLIADEIKNTVAVKMPALVDDLLNAEYTPVSKWNEQATPTTVRKTLIETITNEMVYKKVNYDSDRNFFTKSVDNILATKLKEFQTEYNKLVNEMFAKDVLTMAITHIKTKVGM
jgi:hypothetical protein